ncbi:glycosyltransferase family protein [Variovorax sp. Root411]|uniref:CgeB family protein n=1 Tax=Variovorax sp. Root411 TaxID=1736530 RepID=UPI0006F8620F|nr:glycosyltransferase [Variovorax sp. Root411]KQW54333.1 glycosyltransferase [Variovorax sp. Root411]
MRFVMFCHSLVSDWNHGNAHFLRGICSELVARGHEVAVYEPRRGWSRANLEAEHGRSPLDGFARAYPELQSTPYDRATLDLDTVLDGADVVLVHEWNEPALVRRIGLHRRDGGSYRLLFHDTHHRSVTDEKSMAAYDLTHYDGVLAFGDVVRDRYRRKGWARQAWTWHEAADVRHFHPCPEVAQSGGLVWIGNWGDGERAAELDEFLLEPVRSLGLKASVHGVRYSDHALDRLSAAGAEYGGWLANYKLPLVFARHRVTVHVPRRAFVEALPGIPTIRMFEALACGIPLISAPWHDTEELFAPGDFLVANDGAAMRGHLRDVLEDRELARSLAQQGLATVRARHTCAHRVDELLAILAELDQVSAEPFVSPGRLVA